MLEFLIIGKKKFMNIIVEDNLYAIDLCNDFRKHYLFHELF